MESFLRVESEAGPSLLATCTAGSLPRSCLRTQSCSNHIAITLQSSSNHITEGQGECGGGMLRWDAEPEAEAVWSQKLRVACTTSGTTTTAMHL